MTKFHKTVSLPTVSFSSRSIPPYAKGKAKPAAKFIKTALMSSAEKEKEMYKCIVKQLCFLNQTGNRQPNDEFEKALDSVKHPTDLR